MAIAQNFPEIKPSLNLDFANVKALDPRISFSRASSATYYGTQTAKAEENLLLRSQDFATGTSSITGWAKTRATVGSAVTAPDGTTTAEPLTQATGQTVSGFVNQACNVVISDYVISVFAKPNGKNFLRVIESIGTGSNRISYVDLSNGTAGTVNAGHTVTITSTTEGFYRVSVALSVNATRSGTVFFMLADTDNSDVVTDSGGLILWGAQLEQRSAPTAYIATTDQPITNYIPVLQTASANVARFDHNPVTGESLGLLVEEQRTNLVTYSEDLGTTWSLGSGGTLTTNAWVTPDGTLTGDIFTIAANSTIPSQNVTVSNSTTYTLSFYFHKTFTTAAFLRLRFGIDGSSSSVWFDTQNLTFGAMSGDLSNGTVTAVGNNVYRLTIQMTYNATSGGSRSVSIGGVTANNGTTADTGKDIAIWGMQYEQGAFATSYIKTEASQVTRSADSASMTGTNFSSWYRQDEGTLYGEYVNVNGNVIFGVGNTFDNTMYHTKGSSANVFFRANNVQQANISAPTNATVGFTNKVAFCFKTDSFAAVSNGGSVSTDSSGIPPQNQIRLGLGTSPWSSTSSNSINGYLKKVAFYPARLTNEQLQSLTS